jgi:hypothetical protein
VSAHADVDDLHAPDAFSLPSAYVIAAWLADHKSGQKCSILTRRGRLKADKLNAGRTI